MKIYKLVNAILTLNLILTLQTFKLAATIILTSLWKSFKWFKQHKRKFYSCKPFTLQNITYNIKAKFSIFKLNNMVFQLEEIIYDEISLYNIVSILLVGNKFVPNF
jgi:hypothetical protein